MKLMKTIAAGVVITTVGVSPVVGAVAYADDAKKKTSEQTVSMEQLPAPVKATIEKEAKGGTVGPVTQETAKGKTFYEAEITKDGKQRFVHISPDGKVIKRESAKREARSNK